MSQKLDLGALSQMPVQLSIVLGKAQMKLDDLLKMTEGDLVELDRDVDEHVDILVNDKLIARGEIVVVENKVGITVKEIIK